MASCRASPLITVASMPMECPVASWMPVLPAVKDAPRRMLPPPITTANCVPRAAACTVCRAMWSTSSIEMPRSP